MAFFEDAAFLALFVFFFSRSKLGNRNKTQTWPQWMLRLGHRDTPHIVSSDWFFWIAYVSRRALPVVMAFTFMSLWSYLFGGRAQSPITGPDWLAILGLSFGCFVAYTPFAKKPRRLPLDKWMGMIFGLQFVAFGMLLVVATLIIHYNHIAQVPHSALWHFIKLISSSSLSDTLGIAGGMIGFGVTIMGLVEILPNWRTGVNVVDHSAELEELQLRNGELESENEKLRQKVRSHNRRRGR